MSDEAEPAPEGEAPAKPEEPAKPKGSKLVPLLLLINLGGTGFVGYESMQQAQAAEATAEAVATSKSGHQEKEEKKNEVGPVTPLEPFIVNLNEPEATRYLKATFELEVASQEVVAELEKQKRPIRDELLRFLSGLSVADTQGEVGKAKIQTELVTRINHLLGGERVKRLFFVEFMVQ